MREVRRHTNTERCWSGRTGLPAKQLHWQNRCRGFESPPLRLSLIYFSGLLLKYADSHRFCPSFLRAWDTIDHRPVSAASRRNRVGREPPTDRTRSRSAMSAGYPPRCHFQPQARFPRWEGRHVSLAGLRVWQQKETDDRFCRGIHAAVSTCRPCEGIRRIRHFGVLARSRRSEFIDLCRRLLRMIPFPLSIVGVD
jgi:hypothetical protein